MRLDKLMDQHGYSPQDSEQAARPKTVAEKMRERIELDQQDAINRWNSKPIHQRPKSLSKDYVQFTNPLSEDFQPAVLRINKTAIAWGQAKAKAYNQGLRSPISAVFSGGVGCCKSSMGFDMTWILRRTVIDTAVSNWGLFIGGDDLLLTLNGGREDENGVTRQGITADQLLKQTCYKGNYFPIELAKQLNLSQAQNFGGWAVCVDDVGEKVNLPYVPKDEQAEVIRTLYKRFIDTCLSMKISVILTTNKTVKELQRYIGLRAWDRLNQATEDGRYICEVEQKGVSIRGNYNNQGLRHDAMMQGSLASVSGD